MKNILLFSIFSLIISASFMVSAQEADPPEETPASDPSPTPPPQVTPPPVSNNTVAPVPAAPVPSSPPKAAAEPADQVPEGHGDPNYKRPTGYNAIFKPKRRWEYNPWFGFQTLIFVGFHPSDTYVGANFALQIHPSRRISFSIDGRIGGGTDNDDDNYVSTNWSFGGSLYYWFRGDQKNRAVQPFFRIGFGFTGVTDEHYDDGSSSSNNWNNDWDKKSRNFKKNGVAAEGYSGSYTEEAIGLRIVIFPHSVYTPIGMSFDTELALVQDWHFGASESWVRLGFGFTIHF
ncbi:hypothetical protein KKF34_11285 [Myxococcota bacterium]|nr:hypothetical protein [Myxococcota bacterium]MBU1382554.1 hypothetical protein [Myxococcota bacterium]MBU1497446.1 hypothetical protein [Myxococcota bacterium]